MYNIVIDQSTSATKVLLFDDLKLITKLSKKHQQIYLNDTWVEHDPIEIIDNTVELIEQIIVDNQLNYIDIRSISITNQRETCMAWSKSTGKPIYNAIVWQCRRTSNYCTIMNEYNNQINEITGLRIDSYFSAPKYKWLLDNVKEAKALIENDDLCLGTIDSWLIYNLSEESNHYSDITNSSRTLLMDIKTNTWSEKLCELFSVPIATLPRIKQSAEAFGHYKGIEIKGVMADSQAALYAHNLKQYNEVKITMGTGASMMVNCETNRPKSNLEVLVSPFNTIDCDNEYALEGIIKSFADTIEFIKNELQLFSGYDRAFEKTFTNPNQSNVIFIPGQIGYGCPLWNDDIGCHIMNLKRSTTKNDIVAAAIKSLAYQVKLVIDSFEKNEDIKIDVIKVDGGLSKQVKFLQFIANLTGKQVQVNNIIDASAFGVLSIANSTKEMINTTTNKIIYPNTNIDEFNKYQVWKREIYKLSENK